MTQIVLAIAERASLYFFPPAVGGKVVPEEVQQGLQDNGLITAPQADGRRRLTQLGDKVRLGSVKVTIKD
ncbi:hypothetical protein SNE35_24260 [Paucibacter sp. R3-3]|uniref:Uncharacterized protein n=1 Tax=Roseateles agri TaxID=3098619 RepID=A0ABU5DMU5_9BURK|nr:hypothetical protein [Paucibacter sp. R3-3]MDY0747638.1 hypothetical protein [Paucibacter sp. R3-3]